MQVSVLIFADDKHLFSLYLLEGEKLSVLISMKT